jgi:hypothetical protein
VRSQPTCRSSNRPSSSSSSTRRPPRPSDWKSRSRCWSPPTRLSSYRRSKSCDFHSHNPSLGRMAALGQRTKPLAR